jgi:hypothetical protein
MQDSSLVVDSLVLRPDGGLIYDLVLKLVPLAGYEPLTAVWWSFLTWSRARWTVLSPLL